ncbi:hypothetical protein AOC36_04180 [Erysipelothrix larvae]|uniref:PDZ domain-containing protein n=1 Tax=Erysipelothrix larvae TaxID=1514105 RepID=A0A120JTK6_9FIRM|nr:M50 family metallopeptidase [Erysipelothrix larvae]AMC93197.1 hypothetical protein AOC36_04180 [Erysipelothrix larvae]
MNVIFENLINILVFAAVLSIIVTIHELGHLIAAKKFGVYCREFAIGMGPLIYSKQSKRSETKYSIRALPIGGYVAMAGEPGESGMEDVPLERTINGIARWKRLIVMLAGIFMNLVLAFVVYLGIFSIYGIVDTPRPIIQEVVAESAASEAGMMANDEIIRLEFRNGNVVRPSTANDVVLGITSFQGETVNITVLRDGQEVQLTMTPQFDAESETYKMGVYFESGQLIHVSFFETIQYTFAFIGSMIGTLVKVLGWLVQGIGLNNVGGPIAIYQQTAKVQQYGMLFFWELIASLSVSLAIMNLIPIPVLDGGRALIITVEMIVRKPLPKKVENAVMIAGFAIMLAIMVFFVFMDIKRL